ncbi:MAG: formate dehydrogenase accessory sulfurtransferase FdhD [Pikeienuella sp.]
MVRKPAVSVSGRGVSERGARNLRRWLPEEVPVAFVFDGGTLAVMMASPHDIEDLAHGFALSEGVVASLDEIENFEIAAHERGVEARFWLTPARREALAARRRHMAGPVGCGLCGVDSLEEAMRPLPVVADPAWRISAAEAAAGPERLRARQPLHDRTHAVHAAGFLRPEEGVVLAREDVGRHNALDKLIGAMARAGDDPAHGAFVMTSRVSVELVQKCAFAGCPCLIAASAPTAQALRLAEAAGITVAGFARGGLLEVFSRPDRISFEISDVA